MGRLDGAESFAVVAFRFVRVSLSVSQFAPGDDLFDSRRNVLRGQNLNDASKIKDAGRNM